MMKSLFLTCILSAGILYSASAQGGVSGEGEVVSQELNITSFNGVKLGISANVFLTQGSSQKVVIEAQENIIEVIKKDVKNGIWRIGTEKNIRKHKGITIHITMESLREVGISGSGNMETTGRFIGLDDLEAYVSGSGNLKLDIEAQQVNGAISGSGGIDLSGTATGTDFSVSGSGDIDASGLEANNSTIRISGSGDVHVYCREHLEVSISGSGDVTYRGGNPSVKARVSGSGEVEKVN